MSRWKDIIFGYDKKNSHGSSEFGQYWDLRPLLHSKNKGVRIADFGRLTPKDSFQHSILLASTGAGKSTRFIMPNALQKWKDPVGLVFFDPAGDICENSEGHLRQQGFTIRKIDLTLPNQSEQFNLLFGVIDKNTARMMAQTLIEGVYKESTYDPFWTESAISILTLLILAVVLKLSEEQQTLFFLNTLANKFGHAQDEVSALMQSALGDTDFEEYAAFLSNSVKVRQSIIATVKSSLFSFSDPILQQICARNSFDLNELREQKTALFLIQEEHKLVFYRPFWTLFFQKLFDFLMIGDGHPVYCFLDEAASYRVPNLDGIISTIRRRRVSLNLVIQSYEQLQSIYGLEKARTIFQNCNTKLFLPGLSLESAKMVSEMLGTTTQVYTQTQRDYFDTTAPKQRVSRPLMTPEEVRTLDDRYGLVLSGNHKPFRLHMTPYYRNNIFLKRSKL